MACPGSTIWQGQIQALDPRVWAPNPCLGCFWSRLSGSRVLHDSLPLRAAQQTHVGHSEHTQTCPEAEERSVFCIALATQLESYLNVFQKLFIDLKTVWVLWLLLLFASLYHLILKKFNKHFAEEQNNWSHTCGFPDLFYMCMQCSVTQNMFKPSASNHLGCCGQDQSPTQGSTQGPGPHHSPAPDHRAGGQILAPVMRSAPSWPTPEAPVTGSHRRLKTQSGVH